MRNRTGKPWSGHTIARIIANPAYVGDIAYGEVYVENAHEALISRQTWQKACAISAARASAHTQRAMSDGDYHLTGLITCPACGHKYIGTSATGRNRTYRYYACFSRVRYGTHGRPAARRRNRHRRPECALRLLCQRQRSHRGRGHPRPSPPPRAPRRPARRTWRDLGPTPAGREPCSMPCEPSCPAGPDSSPSSRSCTTPGAAPRKPSNSAPTT